MTIINKLKYPPIKTNIPKRVPKYLIYQFSPSLSYFKDVDRFVLFNTQNNNQKTLMSCFPIEKAREDLEKTESLYIEELLSFEPQKGLGTKMLDFAKNYSKKIGCNGYFHLSADSGLTPDSIPHIFYRKYGMNTKDASINKKLDKFISKGKNARHTDCPNIEMYYPPIKKPETKLQKFLKFFCK